MKPLEDVIRELAAKGQLNHLSIIHTVRGWATAYRAQSGDDRLATHADPVCSIMQALTGKAGPAPEKPARRRAPAATTPPAARPRDEFDDLLG